MKFFFCVSGIPSKMPTSSISVSLFDASPHSPRPGFAKFTIHHPPIVKKKKLITFN
ncbi:hypothetical protein PP707_02465 [Acetobacter pasteurianus]|nr:hypothetical protein [Acetobacter pasteurianus]